ncbi:hypothetical protein [uncultured Erythrobacter sp.]|uniref:hypothetical protein n=1 Tax=uncultured Erythrobacter sp. TaxID=263913 RepID=UPI002610CC65|nr:hypothetical protein [uncultured Erythrobacter sp.]
MSGTLLPIARAIPAPVMAPRTKPPIRDAPPVNCAAPDWGGDGYSVIDTDMKAMQDRAHRFCFIANTLADSVAINIL